MSRPRKAICVSDGGICPVVGQALVATGFTVEHVAVLPDPLPADLGLLVVDRAARQTAGDALRRVEVPVVVVGDTLDDDKLISLMIEAPVSHLLEDPNDRTLAITTSKLATDDIFGLEKYIAPGARIGERIVEDDVAKRRAMDEIVAWAESIGARRPILVRLSSVVDELLMNALNGRSPDDGHAELAAGSQPCRVDLPARAIIRWAADDKTLALSVADDNGTLRQRDVIDHVRRAKDERGRPEPAAPNGSGGAGLGLYLVLANVASLVVNIAPGKRTEVVCLFDLSRGARPQVARARSLHVFAS